MKYEIVPDEDPQNPRTEYENIGTILYTSTHYHLGDRRVTADEIEEVLRDYTMVVLPVFAFIHGETRLSTTPFGDPWDSGQCGIIYTSKESFARAWLRDTWSDDLLEQAKAALKQEVDTFGAYLAGEVVGWIVTDGHGDVVDSCYGYYVQEDAEADAKRSLNRRLAERALKSEHTVTFGG